MDVQKFLQYCISKLVDKPDQITIVQRKSADKTIFEVRVAQEDLARLIGKEGRTFKALRALINLSQTDSPHDLIVDALS